LGMPYRVRFGIDFFLARCVGAVTRPLVFLWGFRLRKQWPCQLLAQSRVWQILYPLALRIGAGDFRGAEQDVPKEQQISEIAFIVHGRVAVMTPMMGMVGSRR